MFRKQLFITTVLFSMIATHVMAQTELVSAINNKLLPLKTIEPGNDFSDLQPLKNILKDKKLIGLGESAHGVHDFFLLKQRLLEFMVKEIGVKALFTETDFAGTKAMNDYVVDGKGDLKTAFGQLSGGVWNTQEFMDMAAWIKSYNDTKPANEKVHFYGFDMTRGVNLARTLRSYLATTNQTDPAIEAGLAVMEKGGRSGDDDRKAISAASAGLSKLHFGDTPDDKFYEHLVRVVAQYSDYISPVTTNSPNEKNDLRDKYMAENMEWLYAYLGSKKAVAWSHSEHLAKKVNSTGLIRAGIYLNEKFGNDYYLLGLCFNSGTIKSQPTVSNAAGIFEVSPVTMDNNTDALLAQCKSSGFILDFKTASTDPAIKSYLNQTVSSYFIGSNYAAKAATNDVFVQHKWIEGYDGIAFIRTVSAATAVRL